MTRMSRFRHAFVAILFVGTLWAQTPAPPTSQSQLPDASAPPAANPSPASTPPPDSSFLELTKKVKPEYPPPAAPGKLQGQVIVRIVVDENGDVESAEVTSGNPVLATVAVDAVKQWKFKPYIKNGQPVKAAIKLPFDFAPPADPSTDDASSPPEKTDGLQPKVVRIQVVPDKPDGMDLGPVPPGTIRLPQGAIKGQVIYRVEPTYPRQALLMRVQGTVVLRAIISKDGTIKELHVIRGDPRLSDAAVDAAKQWRYRPYIFNGEPVEVDTQITMTFTVSAD